MNEKLNDPPIVTVSNRKPKPGIRANRNWLRDRGADYAGSWVALKNGRLMGFADSAEELINKIGEVKNKNILITKPSWVHGNETNAKHMTLDEAAAKVGVSRNTLSVWMRRGLKPPPRKGKFYLCDDDFVNRAIDYKRERVARKPPQPISLVTGPLRPWPVHVPEVKSKLDHLITFNWRTGK